MRRVLPLLALLPLAFAPAPFPKTPRRADPSLAMSGRWTGNHDLSIREGELVYDPAGPVTNLYRLRVDPRARPAAYDLFHPTNTGDAPEWKGIYKLEGDTLTLCYNDARRGRPTAFEGPGRGAATEVYHRVKR
jgi:uncharacterized protein (TIGR03067 family)